MLICSMLEQTVRSPLLGKHFGFPRPDNASSPCYVPVPPAKGTVEDPTLSLIPHHCQKMRMHDVVPFTVTGIDFTGALYVQMNGVESKVYICFFTCATTKAVHLEIVTDLTAETFLLALRRFASRKSLPQIIVSDNGSTYLLAAEELKELLSSKNLMESLNR